MKAERKSSSFWANNRRSGGYLLKHRLLKGGISLARGLLIFGLCYLIIQPIITRLALSVMEEKDLYDSTIVLIPRNFTWMNYQHVFNMTEFPGSMLNTLWISLLVSVCQVASCTLVAYGFARYEFPLKKFWFGCVIALIVIPPQTISTSLYESFANFDIFGIIRATTGKSLNLRGSIIPYVLMCLTCMGLKDGLYIYMLRQYFQGVPKSLEEAAYVDGCSTMHTFTKIMLPDAMPVVTSCFLFSFVWQWTDVFYARNFLATNTRPLFATQLSGLASQMSRYFATDTTRSVVIPIARQLQLISIGVMICSIPLIILYCFAQRTFVESLVMSGSKE